MIIASLQVNLGVAGMSQFVSSMNQANAAINNITRNLNRSGASAGSGFAAGFRTGFLPFLSVLDEAGAAVQQLGRILGSVTGVRTAVGYRDIAAQLEAVTGNAQIARSALGEFKGIGAVTGYNTQEVAAFGARMLSRGMPVSQASSELMSLLDAAAGGGVLSNSITPFMENMLQMRGQRVPNYVDIKQAFGRAPGFGRIFGAGLGQAPMDVNQVVSATRGMSGEQFYQTILKGSAAIAKGAAELQALKSPTMFIGNLFENLNNIMEPTGQILLSALTPIGLFINSISKFLGNANQLSGGAAGLLVLGNVIRTGWRIFARATGTDLKTAALSATAAIQRLTASLWGLSGGAGGAGGKAGGGFVGMMRSLKGAGMMGGLGKMALGGLKLAGGALGLFLPVLADMGLNAWGAKIGGKTGATMQGVGTGIGIGGGLGGLVGGPLGALLGSLAGGLAGGLWGSKNFQEDKGRTAEERTARATEESAAALREIKKKVIGGGVRTRQVTSEIEMQYALAQALRI